MSANTDTQRQEAASRQVIACRLTSRERAQMERGGDQRTKDDISKYGCSVMHVFDAEDDLPSFAYSIGIQQETGAPEAFVIGLKRPMAHSVINEYNRRTREGERFEIGKYYDGFLGEFKVCIGAVPRAAYDEYFGQNIDFYGGREFDVVQIVYPTTKGVWPWAPEASESFIQGQPILAKHG